MPRDGGGPKPVTGSADRRQVILYAGGPSHTVVGDLRVLPAVRSPQLGNARDLLIHLPPSYAGSQRRYPVVYMQDGQNLFDEATALAGEWGVDESMQALATLGLEAIIVGLPHMRVQRVEEYSPFPDATIGIAGRAPDYLAFLVDTVKPLVDATFRTRPEREGTGIAGSSMGGLVSLYAFFHCSRVFGFAGVMSPSLWIGDRSIFSYIERTPVLEGRIYLDIGTAEARSAVRDVARLDRLLTLKGFRTGDTLMYAEEAGAGHSEMAWGRRFRTMLPFLLR